MKHAKVFLDANILIKAGKPPGGLALVRLKDLVNAGFITVLTTDLTCSEVAKKHADNDYDVIKEVGRPHFRNIVKATLGAELPETSKTKLRATLTEAYEQATEVMFKELNCKILTIDKVKPSIVFSSYTADEGFFTHKGKKNQFSDAFIFECLKIEASEKEPIIIVSNDSDFDKPVEDVPYISLVKSLPELFEDLGLKVDAPDVGDFLKHHEEELVEMVNGELDCWGIVGDIEDSEIEETNVTEVEAMELTSFGSATEGGPILVVGSLSVRAELWYIYPNWNEVIYDSEDKHLIPLEYLRARDDFSFNVDVSISLAVDEEGNPEYIKKLNFRDNGPQHVELYRYDSYHG